LSKHVSDTIAHCSSTNYRYLFHAAKLCFSGGNFQLGLFCSIFAAPI
jgi:hypothetical protein